MSQRKMKRRKQRHDINQGSVPRMHQCPSPPMLMAASAQPHGKSITDGEEEEEVVEADSRRPV